MKKILLPLLLLLCASAVFGQGTQSQRVIYTTANPPLVCAPGKLYTNRTTEKVYLGTAAAGCADVTGGAAGSGTVTSVSVTTANGISGTVATETTTPAISLNITGLNAAKIGGGGVSTAEFDFLGTVTSNIQDQLNLKAPITDAAFLASLQIPNGAAPTTDAFGEIAGDNNAQGAGRGSLQFWDGTANTYLVGVLTSDTCTNGQVPTWNTGGTWTCETPAAGAPGGADTQVQFNDAGAFGGDAGLTYNKTTDVLTTGVVFAGGSATGDTSTSQGVFMGFNTTPRIILAAGTAAQNRAIDQTGGTFRIYNAQNGDMFLQMTGANATIGNSSHLVFGNDNVGDFGASGANRARTGYFGTAVNSPTYLTTTNCADSAGAAACGSAAAGSVVIDAAATSVVISTTAVTANSQIFVQNDSSLGTRLSVTCNTQSSLTLGAPRVTARTAGTSFTITIEAGPTTNPMCLSYSIVN